MIKCSWPKRQAASRNTQCSPPDSMGSQQGKWRVKLLPLSYFFSGLSSLLLLLSSIVCPGACDCIWVAAVVYDMTSLGAKKELGTL